MFPPIQRGRKKRARGGPSDPPKEGTSALHVQRRQVEPRYEVMAERFDLRRG